LQIFTPFGKNFKRVKEVTTEEVQYGLWYLEKHKAWITASKSAEIKDTNAKHSPLKHQRAPSYPVCIFHPNERK